MAGVGAGSEVGAGSSFDVGAGSSDEIGASLLEDGAGGGVELGTTTSELEGPGVGLSTAAELP